MNLIGIKKSECALKRRNLYQKLTKLGFTQIPSGVPFGGYIVINPNKEFYSVHNYNFNSFMFGIEHEMFEARNEVEFLKLAKEFYDL